MKQVSILLVDDDPILTPLLTQFLQHMAGAQVLHIDAHGEKKHVEMDVLLINISAPIWDSLDRIPLLRAQHPNAAVIALVPQPAIQYGAAAVAAGADGFVARSAMSTDLLPRLQPWFPALRQRDKIITRPHRALTQTLRDGNGE